MRLLWVLALLLIASPAHANWLDDAWTPETMNATGGPAVTLNAQGVILVLPAVTLEEARKAGLSVKEAITAFLDRYSPQCADVLDMNEPHPGLKVALSLERPFDGDGAELDGVLLPGHLFVTDDEEARFTVDYVPTRKAVCVVPEVPIS